MFFRLLAMFGIFGRFGPMFFMAFNALVGAADRPACKENKTSEKMFCITLVKKFSENLFKQQST